MQSAKFIYFSPDQSTLNFSGNWTLHSAKELEKGIEKILGSNTLPRVLDGSRITQLDSSGAWILTKIINQLSSKNPSIQVEGLNGKQLQLFEMIHLQQEVIQKPHGPSAEKNFLFQIGELSVEKGFQTLRFVSFIGELIVTFFRTAVSNNRFPWKTLFKIIHETGTQALPIIGLLTFLIGVVLAYQMGIQLRTYGANIYIVNLTGMAIFREFGPLITAIIVAGRTGSAFTAQIGTMKVNEEIDALYTMGLSPFNRLVIPKVIGLMIALPLLTVWADCFGVMGSMVMAKSYLEIGYTDFLLRFQHAVDISHYTIGLIKAPVFAMIIAMVGCFQGFQVSSTAESVGSHTTRSVVQAIFLIIIVDAIFSVVFSWKGL